MKHALIQLDGMKIPLIGIPPTATEYRCEVCKKLFDGIHEVIVSSDGGRILCLEHSDTIKPKFNRNIVR